MKYWNIAIVLILLACPVLAQVSFPQAGLPPDVPLNVISGISVGDRFGGSFVLTDLNLDGVTDYLVSSGAGLGALPGRIYAIDGITETVIYTVNGAGYTYFSHLPLSLYPDITSDGISEFAVGYTLGPNLAIVPTLPGSVYVYNGYTGSLISTIQSPNPVPVGLFGSAMVSIGDVNADGFNEFLVGAPNEPRAYVFDGFNVSSLLRTHNAPIVPTAYGTTVSNLGDINYDGVADYAVGGVTQSLTVSGAVGVYSGSGGNLMYSLSGPAYASGFSQDVVSIGDIDLDLYPEIAVSAPGVNQVFIYSGQNGTFLTLIDAISLNSALSNFGKSLASGDVNGDSILDLIVSSDVSSTPPSGSVFAFSGDFLDPLAVIGNISRPGVAYGSGLKAYDIDFDFIDEIIVGDISVIPNTNTYVSFGSIFIEKIGGVFRYGSSGSSPITVLWNPLQLYGNTGYFSVSGLASGDELCFGISDSPLTTPLTLPTGSLVHILFNDPSFTLDCYPYFGSGDFNTSYFSVRSALLEGQSKFAQVAVNRNGAVYTSDAFSFTFFR